MPPPISVIVQDRSTFFRQALTSLLDAEPSLSVCDQVATGDELLAVAVASPPDTIFLEVQSTPWEVEPLLQRLSETAPPPRRLVGIGRPALRGRLRGLSAAPLPRTSPCEAFLRAAGAFPSNESLRNLPLDFSDGLGQQFTERELRVLSLLGAGWTASQIAERLRLSPRSVRSTRERLLAKLSAQSSAQAVAEAIRRGLLGLGSTS